MKGTHLRMLCAAFLIFGFAVMIAYPVAAADTSRADLVITKVTAPSSGNPGAKVALSATVKNIGGSTSPATLTSFYLSKDTSYDSSDSYLGRVNTPSIAPGKSLTLSYSASIPSGSSGTYHIVARADASAVTQEMSEGNNAGSSEVITVQSGSNTAPVSGAPVAQFTASPLSGPTPLTVQFTDQSTGSISSYAWDFDYDGEIDSTKQNPRITFKSVKSFTVKLTVTGPGGSDTEVKTKYITVTPTGTVVQPPVAQFTASATSGTAPLTVQFTDQSTGSISSYSWDFNNDGTVDSTSKSDSYTYSKAGTYTVRHTATGSGGSDSEVKTNYITVTGTGTGAPVAQFTASATSGTAPLTVQFTDQSSGSISSYSWDFTSDGTPDSTAKSASFTYNNPGTYTVSHTVAGTGGSDSEVKTNYISVTTGPVTPPPVAQFIASPTAGTAPLIVQFTDQSTGSISSYSWDFTSDGTPDSTAKSASFTYNNAGTYTVTHTVTGPGGSDSEVKTSYITVTAVPPPSGDYGAESNPTGNPIGGGTGYSRIISQNDPRVKFIVDTKEEFLSALRSAKSGDIIYVPQTANIDLTGVMGTSVPAGVTIAGNRGEGGSTGGRIFQNRLSSDPSSGGPSRSMLYITGDNVRITGLRLEGPDKTTTSLGERVRRGIYINSYNNLEVDNCEMWGWSWSAVHMGDSTSTKTMYIHHNNIYNCQTDGYGYGACVSGGTMIVEGNMFDYTRHAVASSGLVGESYEARYNIIGSHSTNHVFDVHEYQSGGKLIAGRSYKIHHNTVNVNNQYAVVIRAVPVEGAWVDHNKFQWRVSYDEKWSPVCQANGQGNVFMTDNMIGTTVYPSGPIRLLGYE